MVYKIGMTVIALVLIAWVVYGCTTTGPVEDPRTIWCEHNKVRRDKPKNRTDQEDMVMHNLKGAAWCGWKP